MPDGFTGCLAGDAEVRELVAQAAVDIEGLNATFQQTEIRMVFVGNLQNKQELHANTIGEQTSFSRTDELVKRLQTILENRRLPKQSRASTV